MQKNETLMCAPDEHVDNGHKWKQNIILHVRNHCNQKDS